MDIQWSLISKFEFCPSHVDPCFFGSTCTNIVGLFQCACPPGRKGHRCQYENKCNDSSLCAEGETCIETVANALGYDCISTPVTERLHIRLSNSVTANQVHEALHGLVSISTLVKSIICLKGAMITVQIMLYFRLTDYLSWILIALIFVNHDSSQQLQLMITTSH